MPQQPDLTTPEAAAKSQEVYARIENGQCTDATAELDQAHDTNQQS